MLSHFFFFLYILFVLNQTSVRFCLQKPGRSKFEGDYGKRDPTTSTTTPATTTSTLTTPSTAAWTSATAPPSTAATPNSNIHNSNSHTTEESIPLFTRTAIQLFGRILSAVIPLSQNVYEGFARNKLYQQEMNFLPGIKAQFLNFHTMKQQCWFKTASYNISRKSNTYLAKCKKTLSKIKFLAPSIVCKRRIKHSNHR